MPHRHEGRSALAAMTPGGQQNPELAGRAVNGATGVVFPCSAVLLLAWRLAIAASFLLGYSCDSGNGTPNPEAHTAQGFALVPLHEYGWREISERERALLDESGLRAAVPVLGTIGGLKFDFIHRCRQHRRHFGEDVK